MIDIRLNGYHQPIAIKLDGYKEQLLTHDELDLVTGLIELYNTIPELTKLLRVFINNDCVRDGLEIFSHLVQYVDKIAYARLVELCLFTERLQRNM